MKHNQTAVMTSALMLVAISGMITIPLTVVAADDSEFFLQQTQARRDMEERDRAQAEALRAQEEAIRRMEATQVRMQETQAFRETEERQRLQVEELKKQEESIRRMEVTQARMQASTQQLAQQSAEQARSYSDSVNSYSALASAAPSRVAPLVSMAPGRARYDAVSEINFVVLSERLKTYFGAQSGLLVVGTGNGAPFGLQDGDVVISIDGRAPIDDQHAARILRSYQPGERVRLRLQRDRRTIVLDTSAP